MIERTIRSNPSYELILREALSPTERGLVGDVDVIQDAYGYLRPRVGSGLEWRCISTDTALLVLTLQKPGPVPAYIRTRLAGEADIVVERLVLDGVLEMEENGGFVSGPAAITLLRESTHAGGEPGTLGRLSVEALQYAEMLRGLPAEELAMRLYFYGRVPLSPSWQVRLSTPGLIEAFLGVGPEGTVRRALGAGWIENQPGKHPFWRMWTPHSKVGSDEAAYKLYVSPTLSSLPVALLTTADTLSTVPGVLGFKVGRDLSNLCRPDKLVAYFSRLDQLQLAATQLRKRLDGIPPQGVPFTAEITRDGLLSWGIDPTAAQRLLEGRAHASWRLWIVNKLAEYLRAAQDRSGEAGGWRFALDRLRLDGLDTDTWVPTSRLWNGRIAAG